MRYQSEQEAPEALELVPSAETGGSIRIRHLCPKAAGAGQAATAATAVRSHTANAATAVVQSLSPTIHVLDPAVGRRRGVGRGFS